MRAYSDLYKDAIKLMRSEDLKAFDITQEPEQMHELYGKSNFGQGCLLAADSSKIKLDMLKSAAVVGIHTIIISKPLLIIVWIWTKL